MARRTRTRKAVAEYIQVFILIAVVLAGSVLVYAAANRLAVAGTSGAAVSITNASIKQGKNAAVEKVEIANTGTSTLTSFTIATPGITSSAACYLYLLNPTTGAVTSPACSYTGPVSSGAVSISPGQSVIATVTIDTSLFTVGARYTVVVSAVPAALYSDYVVAVPA